jgi:hypothetical protein
LQPLNSVVTAEGSKCRHGKIKCYACFALNGRAELLAAASHRRYASVQGIDLKAGGRNKKKVRTAPKSDNVYLKLIVKVRDRGGLGEQRLIGRWLIMGFDSTEEVPRLLQFFLAMYN